MTTIGSPAKAAVATKSRKPGRPSDYSTELALEICAELVEGTSLATICRRADRPHRGTVMRWLSKYQEFRDLYARGKEISAEISYEKIVDAERRIQLPKDHADYLDPHTARVLIDSIKWRLSKLQPKVYGDKLELAGKVTTTDVVEQAPEWLKQAIRDKTAEVAAERAAQHKDDPDSASTVH